MRHRRGRPDSPAWRASRRTDVLALGPDPVAHPLTYPGRLPAESGLLAGDRFLALRESQDTPLHRWHVDVSASSLDVPGAPATLDDALGHWGGARMADRWPVLAVGSNGSPAQVRRKLAGRAQVAVPMTYTTVSGIVAGFSAHVARAGYIPAAPVLTPGATVRLMVLWLDPDQLAVIDATEPNYRPAVLPRSARAWVPGIGRLGECRLYAARHGCLTDVRGVPLPLAGQAQVQARLLLDLPELARLAGTRRPEEFVARTRRSARLRDSVRELWRRAGRACHQPAW